MRRSLVLWLGLGFVLAACSSSTDKDELRKECTDAALVYYCDQGQLCNAGACVTQDVLNCGAVGNACGVGNVCKDGVCYCEASQSACLTACCDSGCVDVRSNAQNCNGCGISCAGAQLCVNAECVSNCPENFSVCSSKCVDLRNDAKNCGACGVTCPDPSVAELHIDRSYCTNQSCSIVCSAGYVDADTNVQNGCESAVTYECNNGFIEKGESCDADKLNDQTCESQVGEGSVGKLRCASDCRGFDTTECSAPTTCGNGHIDGAERCDERELAGNTCASVLGEGSTGVLFCQNNCNGFDTSACTKPTTCGNSIVDVEAGEVCDAGLLNNNTCETVVGSGSKGTLKCDSKCMSFDISSCSAAAKCGDGQINSNEECEVGRFNGATCESLMGKGSTGTLLCTACKISTANCSAASTCGNGKIDGSDVCDGAAISSGVSCESVLGAGSKGTLRCANNCSSYDISGCTAAAKCGNDFIEGNEVCDKSKLNDKTCATQVGPNSTGTLRCNSTCNGYDTSGCTASTKCGNSVIEPGEVCDGTNIDGATCSSKVGAGSAGHVLCASDCKSFNLSSCSAPSTCGNTTVDAGELCEAKDLRGQTCASIVGAGSTGTLKCGDGCKHFDTSACSAAQSCRDGSIDAGEKCDGTNTGGVTCALVVGYGSTGVLRCASNCSAYDISGCSPEIKCGNGSLDAGEACDGTLLNGRTCAVQVGYGSTGVPECNSTCSGFTKGSCTDALKCGNGTIDSGEVCDGTKINGRTCVQQVGYGSTGTPGCNATCTAFTNGSCTPEIKCGNGVLDASEQCDASKLGGNTCASVMGTGATGTLKCSSTCTFDTSSCIAPPACGNGSLNTGEACDKTVFRNGSNACASYDPVIYSSGTMTCNSNCTVNVSACTKKCGNNTIDAGELCDGTKLNGKTCATQVGGGSTGTLKCSADCKNFDTSSCTAALSCGDGIVNGDEECDGSAYLLDVSTCSEYSSAYLSGNLKCTPLCEIDTSACVEKPVCGDGNVGTGEVCDGANLNGKTCVTEKGAGYTGTLACAGDCKSFNTAACQPPTVCVENSYQCVGQQLQLCMYGEWADDTLCSGSQVCNAIAGQCQTPEPAPEWCNFQHLDTSTAVGYGRILLPSGKTPADVIGLMRCSTTLSSAVESWTLETWGEHNASCSDCYSNTEFMTEQFVASPAKYYCTFLFSFGDANYACLPNGGAPITLTSTTTLTSEQVREITLTSASGPNIFFSEYIEGSGTNKAVEIYNAGSLAYDLSANICKVNLYSNGSHSVSKSILLSGSIDVGGVYSLCNTDVSAASCNQKHGSLDFNGDDAVELVCGTSVYDVIGQIGADPGSEWKSGAVSTKDQTLWRKCNVTAGDKVGSDAFDPSVEWVSKGLDFFSGLGSRGCP